MQISVLILSRENGLSTPQVKRKAIRSQFACTYRDEEPPINRVLEFPSASQAPTCVHPAPKRTAVARGEEEATELKTGMDAVTTAKAGTALLPLHCGKYATHPPPSPTFSLPPIACRKWSLVSTHNEPPDPRGCFCFL